MTTRRHLLQGLAASTAWPIVGPTQAQATFPSRPLTLMVPWPAGAPSDAIARKLQPLWQPGIGQPVIVDNLGGAGGTLGVAKALQQPADGHTVLVGTPTELVPGERARRCPACAHVAYPRISPAMMALVWRPGELLLARSPHYAAGMYSALAGFVEAGESIEHCLHREVAEEVGVQVHNLRYFGSQSWPFPNSLMIAFRAEWAGDGPPQIAASVTLMPKGGLPVRLRELS